MRRTFGCRTSIDHLSFVLIRASQKTLLLFDNSFKRRLQHVGLVTIRWLGDQDLAQIKRKFLQQGWRRAWSSVTWPFSRIGYGHDDVAEVVDEFVPAEIFKCDQLKTCWRGWNFSKTYFPNQHFCYFVKTFNLFSANSNFNQRRINIFNQISDAMLATFVNA